MDLVGVALGKLQINGRLGSGGMGTVYRAFHPGLQVDVAVKVLSAEMAGNPEALVRFRRECTLLARLHHPGLLPVHDADTWEGISYFVMPVVEHPTLEAELESYASRGETYPLPRALALLHSLLAVLEVVHRENVIHRDIKPTNIFVQPSGQVLLTDFGLARGTNDYRVTRTDVVMGTPLWMAPEQLDAQELDHRTDLYQVGLILFRMLAGALPYQNDLSDAVKIKCLAEALPPISTRELPKALHEHLGKLTARSLESRYQSASDAIRDLSRIRAGAAGSPRAAFRTAKLAPGARRAGRQAPGGLAVVPPPSPPLPSPNPAPSRQRAGAALGAAALAVGLVALTLTRGQDSHSASSRTSASPFAISTAAPPGPTAAPVMATAASAVSTPGPPTPEAAPVRSAASPPGSTASPARLAAPPPANPGPSPENSALWKLDQTWPGRLPGRTEVAFGRVLKMNGRERPSDDDFRQALADLALALPSDHAVKLCQADDYGLGLSGWLPVALARGQPIPAEKIPDIVRGLSVLEDKAVECMQALVEFRQARVLSGIRLNNRRELLPASVVFISLAYPEFFGQFAMVRKSEFDKLRQELDDSTRNGAGPSGARGWKSLVSRVGTSLSLIQRISQSIARLDRETGAYLSGKPLPARRSAPSPSPRAR